VADTEEPVEYQEPSAITDVHTTVAPEPVTIEHATVGYVRQSYLLCSFLMPNILMKFEFGHFQAIAPLSLYFPTFYFIF